MYGFAVEDQGPGIPSEHLQKAFDRFFSYRPEEKPSGVRRIPHHSGLGLAIVRAIVDGYGGSVEAVESPHGGARLQVHLPRSEAPAKRE